MDKKIEKIIREIAFVDVELALKKAEISGIIIPDEVYNIIKELKTNPMS